MGTPAPAVPGVESSADQTAGVPDPHRAITRYALEERATGATQILRGYPPMPCYFHSEPARECAGCGRVMSEREAREQDVCDDCSTVAPRA